MPNRDRVEQVWSKLEAAGFSHLKLQEESGWEIVKIESMEEEHISYGFRSSYNGLIVDGLPSFELTEAIKTCKMVTSYAQWELERQFY